MSALMMTLMSTAQTVASPSLLAGFVVVGVVMCLTVSSREEKVWRAMDAHTRADIGLSPYAPAWLGVRV